MVGTSWPEGRRYATPTLISSNSLSTSSLVRLMCVSPLILRRICRKAACWAPHCKRIPRELQTLAGILLTDLVVCSIHETCQSSASSAITYTTSNTFIYLVETSPGGIHEGDQVQPADAARPAGGGAVLGANLAQLLRQRAVELGREGALADAGGVGLDLQAGRVVGSGQLLRGWKNHKKRDAAHASWKATAGSHAYGAGRPLMQPARSSPQPGGGGLW